MLTIDRYLATRKDRKPNPSPWQWFITFGRLLVGYERLSHKKPGISGHAPLAFAQLFIVGWVFFIVVMFVIDCLINR